MGRMRYTDLVSIDTLKSFAVIDRRYAERRIKDIGEDGRGEGIGNRSGIDRRGEGIQQEKCTAKHVHVLIIDKQTGLSIKRKLTLAQADCLSMAIQNFDDGCITSYEFLTVVFGKPAFNPNYMKGLK